MMERFLRYSLERGQKICTVRLSEGRIVRSNLLVTGIDADGGGFTARLPGKKKPVHIGMDELLTCAYARGDRGDLES